ncbi:MAG: hypothetical protein J5I90_21520 [Caldilineales bacterium]|nr:hypothetical protein [Caldilineales bacterium]
MAIPSALLRRFYMAGSLQNVEGGFEFQLKNTIAPATVTSLGPVEVNGTPFSASQVTITGSKTRQASALSKDSPWMLTMGNVVSIGILGEQLMPGSQHILVHMVTREIGAVTIEIEDIFKTSHS